MAMFDSIVVGEDWISEHFFRTDVAKESFLKEVADLEKSWKADDETGSSAKTRFLSARGGLEKSLASLDVETASSSEIAELVDKPYEQIREALGFFANKLEDQTFTTATQAVNFSNVWAGNGRELVVLEAQPVTGLEQLLDSSQSALLSPVEVIKTGENSTETWDVSKALSFIFRSENAPQYILVIAGHWLLLAEQERWAEGRYLAVNLFLALQRNDQKNKGELAHVLACFGRGQLVRDAQQQIWWNRVLEASVKHTVGVSEDLREGIRSSIEIIANDVVTRLRAQSREDLLENLDAQDLARQSLRYLYRILFLLYAEASPEMQVVPAHDPIYEEGYGLDRLRELTLVELHEQSSKEGTHIYESLALLFDKVNQGYSSVEEGADDAPQLVFESLNADLFQPSRTSLIDVAKLSNERLQRVLEHLLLTKEKKGKERGFISYADLGINQLGAVYEGLMSYTGFIAQERLYEVAKGGNREKGSWVINEEKAAQLEAEGMIDDFVREIDEDSGREVRVIYEPGTFVFRLAGRERQQSASYYTPEVLTRFVVSQALEELIDDETTADEILNYRISEPALGSGAFVVEATRQLATEYLKRKQVELGQQIDPEDYVTEYQKVKAQIALHQVYGVDLNSTAVELAEISLWLDTMNPGLHAPWYGLRLRRGNSLIGARRAVYTEDQLCPKKKPKTAWWNDHAPMDAPLTGLAQAIDENNGVSIVDGAVAGKVHQFLLPSDGWGAVRDSSPLKKAGTALDEQKELKNWVKGLPKHFKSAEFKKLVDLSERVEDLWAITMQRMRVAEAESSRHIDYFGAPERERASAVSRDEIEAKLNDQDSAYRRLRRVMDAWCALWFWPVSHQTARVRASQQEYDAYRRLQLVEAGELTDMAGYSVDPHTLSVEQIGDGSFQKTVRIVPPTFDEWIAALRELLGSTESKKAKQSERFAATIPTSWDDLGPYEDEVLQLSAAQPVASVLAKYPWLRVCEQVAKDQGFFHWELDFAAVFARGGFDLQVGNPPWVRPRWDENAIMAEHHPWWQLVNKASNADKDRYVNLANQDPDHTAFLAQSAVDLAATAEFIGHQSTYPVLTGLQPDLYRAFMAKTWQLNTDKGIISLIHPESHFTEKNAAELRSNAYRRLRRHWQFINELQLFEIDHHNPYGIHIYGATSSKINFKMASSLYHPDSITRIVEGNTPDFIPGLKDENNNWDTRPHPERIITVDESLLATWASILDEPGTPPEQARMVYAVNRASSRVLEKLAAAPRVRELGLQYSRGWDESIDRKKGFFEARSHRNDSWSDVIIQGPFFSVANPFAKEPNASMRNNLDYTEIDLEALPEDFIPRTSYQPVESTADNSDYDKSYTHWVSPETGERVSARRFYRLAWRLMAAQTGFRTLYPAIIPPYAAHTHGTISIIPREEKDLAFIGGVFSSIVVDFVVKTSGVQNLVQNFISGLPVFRDIDLKNEVSARFASLVCLTSSYSQFYRTCTGDEWSAEKPVRIAWNRLVKQCEIDALTAIAFGISADELLAIYKTQFSVLQQYDNSDLYDANGRKVPKELVKQIIESADQGANMAVEDRSWTHPQSKVEYIFEPPFRKFDREAELRKAYTKFSKLV